MSTKKILKNNIKLYIILGIIIVLGSIGLTVAITTNFKPIAINITTSEKKAEITYNEGTNSGIITTTGGEILPIDDAIIEEAGESIDNPRVIKAEFNVTGSSNNPKNTIYDVALYAEDISCVLRTKYLKWKLYKNGSLLSQGNLSPEFDTMTNNRLVLTNTQQDLTTTKDKYTFLLWISESCTDNLSECSPEEDQSKYLNKTIKASIKIELATESKKTLKRITSTDGSCDFQNIEIPVCNSLTYNRNNQTLINESTYYTISNNIGKDVGSYSTIIKLNKGFKWQDGTVEDKKINCNIEGAKLTINPIEQKTSYGSYISTNTNQVTTEGLLEGDSLSSILLKQDSLTVGNSIITASNATVVDSDGNDVTNNYKITYNTNNVIVNCQNIASLPTITNYKYTGEAFTGVSAGNYVDVKGVTTAVEPGTYTIYVTPKENYCWPDSTTTEKTLTWSIQTDVATISLDNGVTELNGTPAIYEKEGNYYTNSKATELMTTTQNNIIIPVKVGHTFEGYYTEENGNGTQMIDKNGYATNELLNSTQNQSITLYAYWKPKMYTISYNANGGDITPPTQTKVHGETITIPNVELTKNEHNFLGWSTNKNATSATYLPNDTFTVNANITLYAVFGLPIELTITSSNKEMIGYNDTITELTIPEKVQSEDGTWYIVTTISERVFEYGTKLTKITLPKSVIAIDINAFNNCDKLIEINVSPENEKYTSIDGIVYNKNIDKLIMCPKGKQNGTFNIPETVTTIGEDAFNNCDNLTTVKLPSNLKTIERYAFSVSGITNLTIPDTVTTIGSGAFWMCHELKSIHLPKNLKILQQHVFGVCDSLKNIILPENLTSIGMDPFVDSGTTNITIQKNVNSINKFAFNGASALIEINVSSENETFSSVDGILYDKNKNTLIRYPEGKQNETFTIPETVTTIGEYAFYDCEKLTNVKLSNKITTIEDNVFSRSNIKDIYYTGTEEEWNAISKSSYSDLGEITIHYNYTES